LPSKATLPIQEEAAVPIHDWTRVDAGLFHAFHLHWISTLCNALNAGGLPSDYFAIPEQRVQGPIPDVLALHLSQEGEEPSDAGPGPGLAVAAAPPRARIIQRDEEAYARKASRIGVRYRDGALVAVIEIVSPGNKAGKSEFRAFVEKAVAFIAHGVHFLVIDLFPPTRRDPQGIHKAIWDEFVEEDFRLPADKPLVVAAYDAGPPRVAYVEPVAVRDMLPEIPLFLQPEFYVPAPLEATYRTSWDLIPAPFKRRLEGPVPKP
jgi:hypothetical protein